MSSHNEERGRGRGISTRLTSDKPIPSNSTRTTDNWMSNKRIDRHYRINGGKTKLTIKQGDITNTKVDAIVNAANEHMTGGAGVDGMIHRAAGSRLREECYLHRQVERGVRLPTGRSRILLSYDLGSKTSYIINTAGPVYDSYEKDACEKQLESCYKTALALANLYDLKSIAFPAISCGIFGYPADKGAESALRMSDEHADQLDEVMFILFDDHIYDAWLKKVTEIDYPAWDDSQKSQKSHDSHKSLVKPESATVQDDDDNDVVGGGVPETQSTSAKANPSMKRGLQLDIVDLSSSTTDTQQTQEMEDPDEHKPKETTLEKQQTAEMADVPSQAHETDDKDNSQSQLSSSPSSGATGETSVDPAAAAAAAKEKEKDKEETDAKPDSS